MNKRKQFTLNKIVNQVARDQGIDFIRSYSYMGPQVSRNKLYAVSGTPKQLRNTLCAIENVRGVNFAELHNESIYVYYNM
jgi:hypothetical protein